MAATPSQLISRRPAGCSPAIPPLGAPRIALNRLTVAPIWPVALNTVATGRTGPGAVTGSSPHAIITATPASPIHIIARISLSHVRRSLPYDGKSIDRRWVGASDEWRWSCSPPSDSFVPPPLILPSMGDRYHFLRSTDRPYSRRSADETDGLFALPGTGGPDGVQQSLFAEHHAAPAPAQLHHVP